METFSYTIRDHDGLHARPAGLLAKTAGKFPCAVTLEKNGHKANAKGLFALLGMCVMSGEKVTVLCSGERESEAANVLKHFFTENQL